MSAAPGPGLVHASAVAFETESGPSGVLITGQPGSGKSELALELMGLGAFLVADDQTRLQRVGDTLRMGCPDTIRGLIEMRGIGLITATALDTAPLRLVIDLDTPETERIPPPRFRAYGGIEIRLFRKCASRAFAAAIRQYLLQGQPHEMRGPAV